MKRKNCWEVMKCGREPNGRNENLGVCPAAKPNVHDGANKGNYGGRFCWNFAGTFCGGELQGSIAMKLKDCLGCQFLNVVKEEEGKNFILTIDEK